MSNECMLSTIDNPFNPFENFDDWYSYDCEKGYYCSNYLARIVNLSEDMSQVEENEEIERAIDEIIFNNPLPIYIKVTKDNKQTTV